MLKLRVVIKIISRCIPSGRFVDRMEQMVNVWDRVHPLEEERVQRTGSQKRREGLRGHGATIQELHGRLVHAE